MKKSILCGLFAILLCALLVMGCVSAPKPAPKPTLPLEIMFLSMELGEPEIIEVYAVVVQWTIDGAPYDLVLVYDPILDIWYAYSYGSDGEIPTSSVSY